MTHVKRLKPRIQRNNKLSKLLNSLKKANAPRRLRPIITKKLKILPCYVRKKPDPYNYSRRNHAILNRLQTRKFLTPRGQVRTTLRQALASQNIHQMSRLASKWEDLEQRQSQIQMSESEAKQWQEDWKKWIKQGQPETRENYFWRIKYCGLIELGLEYIHYKSVRQLHLQRQKRGLKNALDHY